MFKQINDFNVHFIGVGGVSMSGLAEYFKSVGFNVSGSDRYASKTLEALNEKGIKTFVGHSEKNVENAHVVVYSDAIEEDNQELSFARESGKYLLSRGEALAMVAENFGSVVGVAGCHGKTTTTCMLAHVFNCAKIKFTAHIGGSDTQLGNFIMKGSKVFLSEVCEFKKNIDKFTADYAVCLNFGKDHMDCYRDECDLKNSYFNYLKRAYKSIINKNDTVLGDFKEENATWYSTFEGDGFHSKNVTSKNGRYSFDLYKGSDNLGRIELSCLGEHNVQNALATSVCALQMGVDFKHVRKGLKNFKGVKRRFEQIGKISNATVIADYAHHPTEIETSLKTAKQVAKGRLFVVFQPHTYSRTLYLKEEFISVLSNMENLALFKTFSARENYIKGGGAYDLCKCIKNARYFEDVNLLTGHYKSILKRNDVLLVLGAGDLYDKIKDVLNG